MKSSLPVLALIALLNAFTVPAAVHNLKVVTDASPDYSDMDSMIHSITANWPTPAEKCWAMFYWNHIARRQTSPMTLHGMAVADPIRQFNDYGYTMCSTISGINCAIWDAMGLKARYWDISNHTVSEVEYDGAWHMYDNSMSAIYTRCDGKTIASVEEIGQTLACDASAGKAEPGHIAKHHCLMTTSPRGFLTGADTIRSLDEEYRCFNPNGLKHRSYFYDWDRGHRYILNLRENESYTRHYHSLGTTAAFFVPNEGKDPEAVNTRYKIRGNGVWRWHPDLSAENFALSAYSHFNIVAKEGGLVTDTDQPGDVVFKIDGANVITSLKIHAGLDGAAAIYVSRYHGLDWKQIWNPRSPPEVNLIDDVTGAYEILVKVSLLSPSAVFHDIRFETTTMLNSKTQPKLNLGLNTIHVGAGEQTESVVIWPDLQGDRYKPFVVEETNIATRREHPGYQGVMHAARANTPAWVVFKIDAPRDVTSIHYGGRLYNRAPRSRIDFLHSFDSGKTWTRSYSLTNTAQPWDVIHFESITNVPAGARSVLFKYQLESSAAGSDACSLYSVRMEARHKPADTGFKPFQVTFNWSERQPDYSLVERAHTEIIAHLPHRYQINVAGADHPVMKSLRISADHSRPGAAHSQTHKGSAATKFIPRWVTFGRNLALAKPYQVTVPSTDQWGSGDPEGKRLTDGIVGPPYPGGIAPSFALGWNKGQNPEITIDLGKSETCAAFRIQLGAGWPWWDALKGEIQDKVELFTSTDGKDYTARGKFNFKLRWKDIPANHFWPDEEVIAAHNFELLLPAPVPARYVRYKIHPERSLTVSELQVYNSFDSKPFDLRIALPRMN